MSEDSGVKPAPGMQIEEVFAFQDPDTGRTVTPVGGVMLRWVRKPGNLPGYKVLEQLFLTVPDQEQVWLPVPTFDGSAKG